MPASQVVRAALESDKQFLASGSEVCAQILAGMSETEEIRHTGVAHVGDSLGFYLVTQRGIHYTDTQKVGLFKKRAISGFIDRATVDHVYVERFPNLPHYAYLRLIGDDGSRVASVWFEDDFSRDGADAEAHAVAALLAGS